MPYIIIFFAGLYFVAAWQNKISYLDGLFIRDLPPYGSFALMIAVIWAIGLIPAARKPAVALLTLVIVAIALTRSSDFLGNLTKLGSGVKALAATPTPADTVQAGKANTETLKPGGALTGGGGLLPDVSLPGIGDLSGILGGLF